MEDQQLIASLKRGNDHAFTILINKYKDRIFSICIKITEDYHLAEEAAQDTFMQVYSKVSQFKEEAKFSTWLYRIAINTAYNKIKQKKPLDSFDDNPNLSENTDLEDGLEKLAKKDRVECLNKALKKLPKLDALVLSLFYLEELSIEELVEVTELSKANVKVKLHRARKKLLTVIQSLMKNEIDSIL